MKSIIKSTDRKPATNKPQNDLFVFRTVLSVVSVIPQERMVDGAAITLKKDSSGVYA